MLIEQKRAEQTKEFRAIGSGEFFFNTAPDVSQQGECPAAFEDFLGRESIHRLKPIPLLRIESVQSKLRLATPALGRVLTVVYIGQVVIQRGQEERTELATLRSSVAERLSSQKLAEKPLDHILGIMRTKAAPSHVGIERIPISAAQSFESFARRR